MTQLPKLNHIVNKLFRNDDAWFTPVKVTIWAFGLLIGVATVAVYSETKAPAHMLKSIEDNNEATVGGQLMMVYDNDKNRFCRNVVNRWIINKDNRIGGRSTPLWYHLDTSDAPPIESGIQHYAVGITIPQNVIPGKYVVKIVTDYYCGVESKLDPESRTTESGIVDITKPTPDSPPQVIIAHPNENILISPAPGVAQ